MFYYRKLTSKDKSIIPQITKIHIQEINDITISFGNEVINKFYELYLAKSLIYGIFEKKSNFLVGFVAFEFKDSQIYLNLLKNKKFILKIISIFFSKNLFRLIDVSVLFIWLNINNFYKENRIQISYTVMEKNYQSKGIYSKCIFDILNEVYKNYNKNYFIKTYSNESITKFYLSKGFKLISKFKGRSILSYRIL